jgi:beta-galactosidase
LNPNVNVQITGYVTTAPWARSLFNGLAQIIVQSTKEAGEIKLTATADGLKPSTATVQTQPCTPRPSVP